MEGVHSHVKSACVFSNVGNVERERKKEREGDKERERERKRSTEGVVHPDISG